MFKIPSLIFFLLLHSTLFANEIEKSMDVLEQTNSKLKNYQEKINNIDDKTQELLNEYKYTNTELKTSRIYNKQLKEIIASQKEELKSINQQLVNIENTQKNIFPLMLNMVESLKQLVKLDTPFLLEERTNRIKRVEDSLNKADIKTAEKYRIILEAFKIEYDYANNMESYQDKIDNKTYNFLRIGRTALYYQSLDLKEYGYWNKATNSWINIEDSNAKSNIRKAIKIANKQQNVDFLNLPFLTLKESK
ncbi:hypothetical protein CRU99_07830 [Malaciobacter mytili]|uniref:DUF3450 domain-containing protein n=1 Tax=Malaciobacter mytili LMG 24559 TaxID=1032238 RepID=A0AAX2AFU0_9BACT|nr:DUF3450 domain-containing protein [Malaciobacter mytili]AXH14028.1 DUF3450 domain-containing protein [Malaciobacter mytili LMG 24559]RXI43374.1 hypothetical protein CRU99_07830 [Malaciobacter mytili]RXK15066.1 hypothetical protein CP985_10415 [Malaciobacter mytili LMG 24559]